MDKDTKKDNKNEPYSDKNKIKFKIFLSSGGEFEITANSKDSFQSVFDEFKKTKNIKELDNFNTGICNGGIIRFDKNLEENNIKENNCVIIYSLKKDLTPNPDHFDFNEKKEQQEMKENNDDLIIDEELLNDLIINDIVNFQSVLLDNIDSNNDKKIDKNANDNDKKEIDNNNNQLNKSNHEHKLIFLFSNKDWNCAKCGNHFNDKKAKYYCSLCDFNLCDNCFTEKKNVSIKRI